jgi:gluconokinase
MLAQPFDPLGLVIVVMGVSGAGKSTLAQRLAADAGVSFLEGDSFHPAHNLQKMAAGIALTDEDRWPWLDALSAAIIAARCPKGVVATCSALKRSYRDRLKRSIGAPLLFVCLQADRTILLHRLQSRQGHFMPVTLLDSQLATLELPDPDEPAIVLSSQLTLQEMLRRIHEHLNTALQAGPPPIHG